MRTIADIKKSITNRLMADINLVQTLELDTSKSWDEQISKASVLNLLIYVVAVANYATEWLFQQFKQDVEARIAAALPGSISWYWNRAMEYQDDAAANAYLLEHGHYERINEAMRIIKHAAVMEEYNTVNIKVMGDNYQPLTSEQLTRFTAYMDTLKFAGTWINISSMQSDDLSIVLHVWRNRLVMPVKNDNDIAAAVKRYLNGIRYGGIFNKTKLMDAVQQVPGVDDVTVERCSMTIHDATNTVYHIDAQNFTSVAGHVNLFELEVFYE